MAQLKSRSEYFKNICHNSKLIAHDRLVDGEMRSCYFRMNDEEELDVASNHWIHFPCVVHTDFSYRFTGDKNAMPKRKTTNALLVLDKADNVLDMDAVEDAKDRAQAVVDFLISRMYTDFKAGCGVADFDLARVSVQPYGPVNGKLFGWILMFEDEKFAKDIYNFDKTQWFDYDPPEAP